MQGRLAVRLGGQKGKNMARVRCIHNKNGVPQLGVEGESLSVTGEDAKVHVPSKNAIYDTPAAWWTPIESTPPADNEGRR